MLWVFGDLRARLGAARKGAGSFITEDAEDTEGTEDIGQAKAFAGCCTNMEGFLRALRVLRVLRVLRDENSVTFRHPARHDLTY
jgi:hypothetical protein